MCVCVQCDREQLDPRGRTPLHLAVMLAKVRCADVLLRNGANALALNRHKWNGELGEKIVVSWERR